MKRVIFSFFVVILLTACSTGGYSPSFWRYAEKCPCDTQNTYKRIVLQSGVHAGLMHDLDVLDHVVGMFEMEAVTDTTLQNALIRQGVVNLGNSLSPQIEKIIALKPDALFLSPIENSGFGALENCEIPIVECADYMENSPLGRAEWMRYYGRLTGCGEKADSLFEVVENQYLHGKSLTQNSRNLSLLVDFPQFGAWYVPGGKSYLAQIYADAGLKYVFGDNDDEGSVPMNFETVFQQAKDADVWIVKYGKSTDYTLDDLLKIDSRFAAFSAFQKGQIWGCNTYRVPYYESLPFHPERLLRDLRKVGKEDGVFYQKLH